MNTTKTCTSYNVTIDKQTFKVWANVNESNDSIAKKLLLQNKEAKRLMTNQDGYSMTITENTADRYEY